jgi:hypothetical protein
MGLGFWQRRSRQTGRSVNQLMNDGERESSGRHGPVRSTAQSCSAHTRRGHDKCSDEVVNGDGLKLGLAAAPARERGHVTGGGAGGPKNRAIWAGRTSRARRHWCCALLGRCAAGFWVQPCKAFAPAGETIERLTVKHKKRSPPQVRVQGQHRADDTETEMEIR